MLKKLFVVLVFVFLEQLCWAENISSLELINNAQSYDGRQVTYRGEVIGDVMPRDAHLWLNVSDEKSALGIWAEKTLVPDIKYTGSFKAHGDIIEVEGRFNKNCLEHGGDLDIHAQKIKLINPGYKTAQKTNKLSILSAVIMFLIILFLKVRYRLFMI